MNYFKYIFKCMIIFAACVFATSAYALEEQNKRSSLFEQLDANQDGKLSLKEFPKRTFRSGSFEDIFKRLDADQDGFISKDEMPKGRPGGRRQ